jgi:CubicO group peptidase (beta-lactamase class C family)
MHCEGRDQEPLGRIGARLAMGHALLPFFCLGLSALSQEEAPSPAWAPAVDALFAEWDRASSPGCAFGVIQEGKLVHARGFGRASLEHSLPITPRTVFDIGSTSKQFTAAAIGLLAQENRLGVDDALADWVPELADLAGELTLDHLLHHTSGLPDYLGLMARKGARTADWTTPEDALAALCEVEELDFVPGSRFEYSNSNYFLLSLVGARAGGQPFHELVRERLFQPLGMADTLLLHDHTLVVPRRATGYGPRRGGGFRVDMSDFEQLGDGAVQTTVEDLLKWDANFASRAVGGDALHAFLHEAGRLTDGRPIEYARGLFVDEFRGLARVSHGGAWAGYRAQLMRFPEQRTSFVCLSNLASMDPTALCEGAASLVLAGSMTAEK